MQDSVAKQLTFSLVNKLMTKKEVSNVIDYIYRHCGQKDTVIFCDRLMALGFGQACNSGISFGIADLTTPSLKEKYVSEAEEFRKVLRANILMVLSRKVRNTTR